jgi:hypothetical protein
MKDRDSTFALRLPPALKAEIAEMAKRNGTSINAFIVAAATEKLSARSTEDFFAERRARPATDVFERLLYREDGEAPRAGDEIPAELVDEIERDRREQRARLRRRG